MLLNTAKIVSIQMSLSLLDLKLFTSTHKKEAKLCHPEKVYHFLGNW